MVSKSEPGSGDILALVTFEVLLLLYEINIIVETLFQTFHDVSFQDNSS